MRTDKQIETSRINGARSRGPVTTEGKTRSSQNATKHGLTGQAVVLACEDRSEYEAMLLDYQNQWQPCSQAERDLVSDIANSRWRLNRLLAMETATMDIEIERQSASDSTVHEGVGACAQAYRKLVFVSKILETISRHESRLRRTIDRAAKQLAELKRLRLQDEQRAAAAAQSPQPQQPRPARTKIRQNEPTAKIHLIAAETLKPAETAPQHGRRDDPAVSPPLIS
jgi:hypothetical protein